jgi:ribosomal-protein-alanine N-acetyltransferase
MLTPNFQPFPVLHTERLTLRQLTDGNAGSLFVLRSNPDLMRYIPRPLAVTPEDALALVQRMSGLVERNEAINWGMFEKGTNRLIGTIGYVKFIPESYRAEVGYMLHQEYHGTGIMAEALRTVIDYGFKSFGLHVIEAIVHPDNIPSQKILEKHGFERAAYFKDYQFFDGRFIDSLVFWRLSPYPFTPVQTTQV